jgi:hypothetical protein
MCLNGWNWTSPFFIVVFVIVLLRYNSHAIITIFRTLHHTKKILCTFYPSPFKPLVLTGPIQPLTYFLVL